MGKQGRPPLKSPSEELLARIDFYRETLFRGNQRVMADALGVSESLISKVTKRVQRPSDSLVELLARQPLVNREWLLYGQGQALLASTAGSLPISTIPLPGSPAAHPGLLPGRRHPVASPLEALSRYWLELASDSDVVVPSEQNTQPGDLLLTETAPEYVRRVEAAMGRLCVVAVTLHGMNACCLARVFSDADVLYAELYSRHAITMTGKSPELLGKPMRRRPTLPREVTVTASSSPSAAMARQPALPSGVVPLASVEAIVGVCLMLERPNLMAARGSASVKTVAKAKQLQENRDFDKDAVKHQEKARVKN